MKPKCEGILLLQEVCTGKVWTTPKDQNIHVLGNSSNKKFRPPDKFLKQFYKFRVFDDVS